MILFSQAVKRYFSASSRVRAWIDLGWPAHFPPPAVNDPRAPHQRVHDFVFASSEKIFLGFEPRARVDRLGMDVQFSPSRGAGRLAFLHGRKTTQYKFCDAGVV